MYRDLIPFLANRFHAIAPELPGFGQSDTPLRAQLRYTFNRIAGVIDRFTEVINLDRFAVYVFDDGALDKLPDRDPTSRPHLRDQLPKRQRL